MGKQQQEQQNHKIFADVIKNLETLRSRDHSQLPSPTLNVVTGSYRKIRKSKEEDNVTATADWCDVTTNQN